MHQQTRIAVGICGGVIVGAASYAYFAGNWREMTIQGLGQMVGVWSYWMVLRLFRSEAMTAPTVTKSSRIA